MAAALRVRAAEAHARMARGFAAWIADGIIGPVASPDTLATVFRALVVGLEMQHRIDPGAMDVDGVTAALGRVLNVEVHSPT